MALLNSRKASELIRNQTGRGCTRQNLESLCRKGRLPHSCKSLTPIRLDPDTLIDEYLHAVDPRQAGAVNRGPAKARDEAQAPAAPRRLAPGELRDVIESRRLKEHHEAELARLKSEQMDGTLILAVEAEAAIFARSRVARDALQGITPRVLDDLCDIAGSLDADQRHRVQEALDRELVRVCEALAVPVLTKGGSDAG